MPGRAKRIICGNRAAEGLREVRPVDETEHHHAREERVDVDLIPAQHVGEVVQPDLDAVEEQQHQHEVRHTANERGVERAGAVGDAVFGELGRCADQPEHEREHERQHGELDGLPGAGEDQRAVALKKHGRVLDGALRQPAKGAALVRRGSNPFMGARLVFARPMRLRS
jgi:hypothetical protein